MRCRLALGVLLFLGVAAFAPAEESKGSWWTFWKSDKKDAGKKAGPTVTPEMVRAQQGIIDADLKRRLAVCLELQNVAAQNGDDELQRKAEQLEQRVWDLHRTQQANLPIVSTPERKAPRRSESRED